MAEFGAELRGPYESAVSLVERYIRDYLADCDASGTDVDTDDLAEQIVAALDRRTQARIKLKLTDPPSGFHGR